MEERELVKRLKKTVADIERGLVRAERSKNPDAVIDFINSYFYGWDGYQLIMSSGGPSEGFKIGRNRNNEIADMKYYYYEGPGRGGEIFVVDWLSSSEYEFMERLYYDYLLEVL